jgi:hypothetical protein
VLKIIFTLDYEIHGNGDGNPQELMVEPTYRLLRLCDKYGAKVTIMADVAEILKFKEYKDIKGRDDYCADAIEDQLRYAIKTGHDVQLHIHSSYFNARHENGKWVQDWSEYNFAGLPYERVDWMVASCKEYLEALLKPVNPDYKCTAFRAANWSVSPSKNVVKALVKNDISIDTSVFKYGHRKGIVTFDYNHAHSQILPWPVNEDDICIRDDKGKLWELPIYTEMRWIGSFFTFNRIYRAISGRGHKIRNEDMVNNVKDTMADDVPTTESSGWMSTVLKKHAWKADFNQCVSKQLIAALNRATFNFDSQNSNLIPFILIGHSKLFTQHNEYTLAPYLEYCKQHSHKYGFDTLYGLNALYKQWQIG